MGRNRAIIGLELDKCWKWGFNCTVLRLKVAGCNWTEIGTETGWIPRWAQPCSPPFSPRWVAGKQDCSYISKTHMRMYRRIMELKMTIMNRRKLSGQSRADSQGIHYITKRFVTSTHTHKLRLQFVQKFSGTCSCPYKLQASWCILASFPPFFCSSVCIIYRTKNRVGLGMRLIHTS